MIELNKGVVAVLKDGRILCFPERDEYDQFIAARKAVAGLKRSDSKKIIFLFGSPKIMADAIRRMSDAERRLHDAIPLLFPPEEEK